ncbi:GNAT family N-acetyltransferase [Streptomyces sp. NRRL F-5727]|uniref:GNAT family N-acetyltransferase n=1 Tax=Streptomyces sp. NRRL F-5727 TaxID=1463871 RepID=UPI0004C4FC06|nr:GNAT family N-acetyltransferase [Streptomyces sp. NRRL F-5727]
MKIEPVATGRLLLHPLTVPEGERIAAREPLPEDRWAEGYPGVGDLASVNALLRRCAEDGDPGAYRTYQIRLREGGLVVGGIGFHGPPGPDGAVIVGYGIVPGERGKGYASEALAAVIGIAREAGAAVLRGDADPANVLSHRVMERAGMRRVGEGDGLVRFLVELGR